MFEWLLLDFAGTKASFVVVDATNCCCCFSCASPELFGVGFAVVVANFGIL